MISQIGLSRLKITLSEVHYCMQSQVMNKTYAHIQKFFYYLNTYIWIIRFHIQFFDVIFSEVALTSIVRLFNQCQRFCFTNCDQAWLLCRNLFQKKSVLVLVIIIYEFIKFIKYQKYFFFGTYQLNNCKQRRPHNCNSCPLP